MNKRLRKQPKYVQEFSMYIDSGFLYTQLLHETVKAYNQIISDIAKRKRKAPRSVGPVLREAMSFAKNKLKKNGCLTDRGLPTTRAIDASRKLIGTDRSAKTTLTKTAFNAPFILGAAIGDYKDYTFQKATRRGSANVNHSCKVVSNLRKELNTIRKAMDNVFSCDTAFGTCNNNSMSSGHCMLSALIIQDMYGGKIISGQVSGIPHYWNRMCHMDVDLTGDQFKKPKVQIRKDELYGNSFEFTRSPFESLNQDFNREVWSKHCEFRSKVQDELNKIDKSLAEKLKKASEKLKE